MIIKEQIQNKENYGICYLLFISEFSNLRIMLTMPLGEY